MRKCRRMTALASPTLNLLGLHPTSVEPGRNACWHLYSCDGALAQISGIKNLQFLLLRFIVPNKHNDITMVF